MASSPDCTGNPMLSPSKESAKAAIGGGGVAEEGGAEVVAAPGGRTPPTGTTRKNTPPNSEAVPFGFEGVTRIPRDVAARKVTTDCSQLGRITLRTEPLPNPLRCNA